MFKESKPSSGRLSSPLLRRRIPTVNHQYMSPQSVRKSRIPGIGRMKKKRSVPEGLTRVASPESSSVPPTPAFCEDPRNLQIKEQVGSAVCMVCLDNRCNVSKLSISQFHFCLSKLDTVLTCFTCQGRHPEPGYN